MKALKLRKSFGLQSVFTFAIAVFLIGAVSISAGEGKRDVLKESFKVADGGTLEMDVEAASIEIRTQKGRDATVEVIRKYKGSEDEMQKALRNYKIDFIKSGNDLSIESKKETRNLFGSGNQLQVRFIVTVPMKYNLDLKTSGGSISVADIEGEAKIKTSGGSLKCNSVKGSLQGKTSGGSIKIKECTGDVDVKTSGGSISVKEVMGNINAKTSGGSIKVYISKQPTADCKLKTSGGSIRVELDKSIKVNLEAKTSAGRVNFGFPVEGKIDKDRADVKINGGGPELELKTSGGSITINQI
ncbi:MAG: DUF4097 domain-containing protein [bacterium]|nr:DUF4097 domain-containing protein [bacterium]